MSLFKTFTPRTLYYTTLRMIGTLFVHPPKMDSNPSSYFRATLVSHDWIKKDLTGVVTTEPTASRDTTIEQVHASLCSIEKMLFGTDSTFEVSVKGCCLYTESLEYRLTGPASCTVC